MKWKYKPIEEKDEEGYANIIEDPHPQAEEHPFDIFSRPPSYAQNLGDLNQSNGDILTYIGTQGDGFTNIFYLPRSPSCMANYRKAYPSEVDLAFLDWDEGLEGIAGNSTLGDAQDPDPYLINGVINWGDFVQES